MRIFLVSGLIFSFLAFPLSGRAASDDGKISTKKILEEQAQIVKPGILPDSFFYWADIFSEELRFVFTIGKEKKADYLLIIAAERLAEMKALTEAGINKYTDKLISEHEDAVSNAEKFYAKLKEEGIKKAKGLQADTEKEIYQQEKVVKKELAGAPQKYVEKRDSAVKQVLAWFKKVISHLSWKKGEIEKQEAQMSE